MIISASRRTDIPAFYPEWLEDKVRKGSLCVRNPMQETQVGRVNLSPDVIDAFVFWTKNPAPMISRLSAFDRYAYYFQYTLNYYGDEMEPNLPKIEDRIRTFIELSDKIGKERVIWRYDPIVFTPVYTPEWHLKCFDTLAQILTSHTEKVVISLVDIYPAKNGAILSKLGAYNPDQNTRAAFLKALAGIAHMYGLVIATCAENLTDQERAFGIAPNACIDRKLIERLLKTELMDERDGQRGACMCQKCIDIGSYDTCTHGCVYCYANYRKEITANKIKLYDPSSDLLCDSIRPGDRIYDRKIETFRYPF